MQHFLSYFFVRRNANRVFVRRRRRRRRTSVAKMLLPNCYCPRNSDDATVVLRNQKWSSVVLVLRSQR
jgi:hypothetical protein